MRFTQNEKDSRGFTLLELVVVLAVIAILAAILTPMINGYVDRARNSAAISDMKNIAAGVTQFNTDMKFWPIYTADFGGNSFGSNIYDQISTSGGGDAAIGSGVTGWVYADLSDATKTGTVDSILNNDFYTAFSNRPKYRGPYLQLGSDPWGTKYYVTTGNLKPGSNKHAYVLSAGPNQTIDTNRDQLTTTNLTVGGDDLIIQIK